MLLQDITSIVDTPLFSPSARFTIFGTILAECRRSHQLEADFGVFTGFKDLTGLGGSGHPHSSGLQRRRTHPHSWTGTGRLPTTPVGGAGVPARSGSFGPFSSCSSSCFPAGGGFALAGGVPQYSR